jgi:hypothetical protein
MSARRAATLAILRAGYWKVRPALGGAGREGINMWAEIRRPYKRPTPVAPCAFLQTGLPSQYRRGRFTFAQART